MGLFINYDYRDNVPSFLLLEFKESNIRVYSYKYYDPEFVIEQTDLPKIL